MVKIAKKALEGSEIKVASVATAFPSGQAPRDVKNSGYKIRGK
jgi:deoxyribose-phosphate aldolase